MNTIHKIWTGILLTGCVVSINSQAQLPITLYETYLPGKSKIETTLSKRLDDNRLTKNIFTVLHTTQYSRGWSSAFEISTFDKMLPTASPFVGRANQLTSRIEISKDFTFQKYVRVQLAISDFRFFILSPVRSNTEIQKLACTAHMKMGVFKFSTEVRGDKVANTFYVKDLAIQPNRYNFITHAFIYETPALGTATFFTEATVGTYYHIKKRSLRFGERVRLGKTILVTYDLEACSIIGNKTLHEFFGRMKLIYSPSKIISSSIQFIGNSCISRLALISELRYHLPNGSIGLEYRELRNAQFQLLETNHPFFSSQYLFSYNYRFNN